MPADRFARICVMICIAGFIAFGFYIIGLAIYVALHPLH